MHDYSEIVDELGGKDEELTQLVTASNQVFSALAEEETNVAATVSKLPGTLRQTESTLTKVEALGDRLGPALNALRPPFRRLDETNAAVRPFVREAAPIVENQIRPFTRATRPYVASLGGAARNTVRALPDLTKSLDELNRFFNMGAYNRRRRGPHRRHRPRPRPPGGAALLARLDRPERRVAVLHL